MNSATAIERMHRTVKTAAIRKTNTGAFPAFLTGYYVGVLAAFAEVADSDAAAVLESELSEKIRAMQAAV